MKNNLIYIGILFLFFYSCEDIYVPDLDTVENYLVVEGRLNSNQHTNQINLYYSENFNNKKLFFPPVANAIVILVSDSGERMEFTEISNGEYQIDFTLETNVTYHLEIEVDGIFYKSEIQTVPELPRLDSIYGELTSLIYVNDKEEVVEDIGFRLYTDIKGLGSTNKYRFYGRNVVQSHYSIGSPQYPVYVWNSYRPSGIFNLAGPAEYSTSQDIIKHPLEFYPRNTNRLIVDTHAFDGVIYIIDEYSISDESYNYYKLLNSQLGSEGKIFDPVNVQPKGNIICTSDPEIVVLGNFEIASYREHRYFLYYNKKSDSISIKKIPYFYEIPFSGSVPDYKPDFWESLTKKYPNGN